MALPVYGSAGAGSVTLVTPFNIAYPASISAGNTLVLHVVIEVGAPTPFPPTTPSGWTLAYGPDNLEDGSTTKSYVYIKNAAGSESGNLSFAFAADPDNGAAGRMYRFTGSDSTYQGSSLTSSNDTEFNQPSITTTGTDRLVLCLLAVDRVVTVGAFTGTTGGTWTEAVAEYSTTTGEDFTLQLQTCNKATAGTISGGSVTPNVGGAYSARVFALNSTSGTSTSDNRDSRITGQALSADTRDTRITGEASSRRSLMMLGTG